MTHPKAGEWWCPGSFKGTGAEGATIYSGCDGVDGCPTCHGRPLGTALEGRVSLASWWERESNTYKGRMLRGWANLVASRYGRPVYLTGSAVKDVAPRDIDVRVVMSKSEFEARFGKLAEHKSDLNGHVLRLDSMDDERRWHVETAKMNKQGAANTHLPIDFQVQSIREGMAFVNEHRVRLDDLPGLVPPWED